MSMVVREALSKALYELIRKGETKVIVQVPFVNKEGESLPDEDVDITDIVTSTRELLEAGASPLFYVTDTESFLLPVVIQQVENSNGFSEETRTQVIELLMSHISQKELKGLLPEHSNLLFKQMLYHEKYLDELITRGLEFKQDIDSRYGNDSVEIEAIKSGNTELFLKIAQNSMELDFEILYNKDRYNETNLTKELEKIKEKVATFIASDESIVDSYQSQKNDRRKELIKILDNWLLKNKMTKNSHKSNAKESKLKI